MLPALLSLVIEWGNDFKVVNHVVLIVFDQLGDIPFDNPPQSFASLIQSGISTNKATSHIGSDDNHLKVMLYGMDPDRIPLTKENLSIIKLISCEYNKRNFKIFSNWPKTRDIFEGEIQENIIIGNRSEIIDKASNFVSKSNPIITVIHLHPDPENQINNTSAYINAADECVDKILNSLRQSKMLKDTAIILTTTPKPSQTRITWIICGPYIPRNIRFNTEVTIYDTVPSIAYLLDLKFFPMWQGVVPYLNRDAFERKKSRSKIPLIILLLMLSIVIIGAVFCLTSTDNGVEFLENEMPRSFSFATTPGLYLFNK